MSIPSARLHQLIAEQRRRLSRAIVDGTPTLEAEQRLDQLFKEFACRKVRV